MSNIFDSDIHDIQMEISRLQEKKKLLLKCQNELKEWGDEDSTKKSIGDRKIVHATVGD